MSRKRYISTEISTDNKISELAECGLLAPLLFTWAIPHMDDWGRITGNAREFKLLVCPGLDVTNRDVEDAINHIVNAKLWIRYEHEGKQCISVMNQDNWFKHQSYIGKDKRLDDSKSSFPTPRNAEEHRELPKNPSSLSFSLSVSPSLSVSDSNITDTTKPPEIILQDEFCRIHAKGEWTLKQSEYQNMQKITSMDIPLDFIISTMTKIYEFKKTKSEKVTSFNFYLDPIVEAWNAKSGGQMNGGFSENTGSNKNSGSRELEGWESLIVS